MFRITFTDGTKVDITAETVLVGKNNFPSHLPVKDEMYLEKTHIEFLEGKEITVKGIVGFLLAHQTFSVDDDEDNKNATLYFSSAVKCVSVI